MLHDEGPLLILAGAGSGKTRVLTHRIAHLVGTGQAQPGEILAITFTNKAANEMRERVGALVGRRSRAMWVMTFHSACARILRAEAERLGYTRRFTIYDEADSVRLVKNCIEELDVDPKRFPPRGHQAPDLRRQEPAAGRRGLPAEGRLVLRADRGRRLRPLRAAPALGQRDGLRRPAVSLGEPVRALPRGPRPLPQQLPPRAGRRVPGHQPRPVPVAPAAGRGAPQPVRGRRRRPVASTASAAPTSATSSTSRTTSPTPTRSSWSRTTAPRRPSSPPPTA